MKSRHHHNREGRQQAKSGHIEREVKRWERIILDKQKKDKPTEADRMAEVCAEADRLF